MKAKTSNQAKLKTLICFKKAVKDEKKLAKKKAEENEKKTEILPDDEDSLDQIFKEVKKVSKEKKSKAEKTTKIEDQKTSAKRRYTEDGLPIYTEEELKINNPNAGKTPLCPFDCDCCF